MVRKKIDVAWYTLLFALLITLWQEFEQLERLTDEVL